MLRKMNMPSAAAVGFAVALLAAHAEVAPLPEAIDTFNRTNLERYAENPEMLVRPGLLADRKGRVIHIPASSTGIGKHDPVEFLLIAPASGHDYEAFAVAYAKPSDVHAALQFIGLEPGRSVSFPYLAFWPKGERVNVTISCRSASAWSGRVAAETLVQNRRINASLPVSGFAFVGSRWITEPDGTNRSYRADVVEPHAIISLYNETGTVLDLPRQVLQNDVYDSQFPNPHYLATTNDVFDFEIRPVRAPGEYRVRDLELRVSATAGQAPALKDLVFSLDAADDRQTSGIPVANAPLPDVIKVFSTIVSNDIDPYVSVHFADAVPIDIARQVSAVLAGVESEKGIRLEPPAEGQLYYKAFTPDERHRRREDRIAQPWELHVPAQGSTNRCFLVHIKEIWKDDQLRPDLEATDYPIETSADLRRALDTLGPGLPVILVFAEPGVRHGELMRLLAPAMSTHGTVHVFTD